MIVYGCSRCRLHYIDYLDDIDIIAGSPPPDDPRQHFQYVDSVLHANGTKFAARVDTIKPHSALAGSRCLDIGAGGGLFLSLLHREGAHIAGLEPDPLNRLFARERYGIELASELIEHPDWQIGNRKSFDIVTLWDVVEHLNFPRETLAAAVNVLKPAGLLCLDTPIRDAFLYRAGELAYRGTRGRAGALLAAQYSRQPFGHKQIFASSKLKALIASLGCSVVRVAKIHELSFPYHVYLRRILGSSRGAALAAPLAGAFFRMPVRNKVLLLARKTTDPPNTL